MFAIAVMIWAPTVGSTSISLARAFDRSIPWDDNVDAQIFFVARLPRVLAGGLVGATLAAAGVVLQALLRNPLATPFTLGVSAGASLGAMLAVTMRLELSVLGITSIPLASFAGSLIATGIVYALASSQRRGLSTNVLLLAGVTLNAFFSAVILFVQYLADFAEALRAIRWMMGGLDVASYVPIVAALPFIVVSFGAFAMMTRTLNLLSVGSEAAASRGVEHRRRPAAGVHQRVARHGRGGLARRPDRLHRHHRAAPCQVDGGIGSSNRAAGVGAVRSGLPGVVRPGGADADVAARNPGRRRHGADRRTVLPVVIGEKIMKAGNG